MKTTTNKLNIMETTPVKAEDFGLEPKTAQEIEGKFTPSIVERDALTEIYTDLIKGELTPELAVKARDLRLKLVKVRTGISSIHKTQKAFYLAGGKFVDAWKNKETEPVTLMEEKLKEIEDHETNKENERIEKLKDDRIKELNKIGCTEIPAGIGTFDETTYQAMFKGLKLQQEEKAAEAKKAEELRIENKRLDDLHTTRNIELAPYAKYSDGNLTLREMPEDEYQNLLSTFKRSKEQEEKEQEETRKENARLKEEAEKKEAQEKKEQEEREIEAKKKEELRVERSQKLSGLIATMPEKYSDTDFTELTFREFENVLVEAKAAKEAQDKLDQKEADERKALQDKVDAQEKAEKQAKEDAEKKEAYRAKQGDKGVFELCANNLEDSKILLDTVFESKESEALRDEVNGLIRKVINHINTKS